MTDTVYTEPLKFLKSYRNPPINNALFLCTILVILLKYRKFIRNLPPAEKEKRPEVKNLCVVSKDLQLITERPPQALQFLSKSKISAPHVCEGLKQNVLQSIFKL